jgi:hypothetical protein
MERDCREYERQDAAAAVCDCADDARGWWDCVDCAVHGAEARAEGDAEHKSEMDAENAWLRHAENQGFYDDDRGW